MDGWTDATGDRRIYLDNNATTKVDLRVAETMVDCLTGDFGNPSSQHGFGRRAQARLGRAREQAAALVGAAAADEVVFTSGGSEADMTAILSGLAAAPDRRALVTSAVEHPAVLNLCRSLEAQGCTLRVVPVDGLGRIDWDAYSAAVTSEVALVSIMTANHETGTLLPVAELAERAHAAGALFHTDAVQAAGKLPLDVAGTAIDMLSVSGHKFHGPKGTGFLYVRRGTPFLPLILGGHQEGGRRAGTENLPGIAGLGRAAELARADLMPALARMARLRDRLEAGLLARVPGCRVLGDPDSRLANTCYVAFDGVDAEGVLALLDRAGIAASAGSACTSGRLEPSHIVRAMGVPETAALGAVRLSLSRLTTEDEIDAVLETLPAVVADLRDMSPFADADGLLDDGLPGGDALEDPAHAHA